MRCRAVCDTRVYIETVRLVFLLRPSCVPYRWRSASWCGTGWVSPAPESRSYCQSHLGHPRTRSGTPKPAGTACGDCPEYSNKPDQNKHSGHYWRIPRCSISRGWVSQIYWQLFNSFSPRPHVNLMMASVEKSEDHQSN